MIQKCLLVLMIIDAIAGPFYNIIKVMMKGPNKRSNLKKNITGHNMKFYSSSVGEHFNNNHRESNSSKRINITMLCPIKVNSYD